MRKYEFITTVKALSKARHTMQSNSPTLSEKTALFWIDSAIIELGFVDLDDVDNYLSMNKKTLIEYKEKFKNERGL